MIVSNSLRVYPQAQIDTPRRGGATTAFTLSPAVTAPTSKAKSATPDTALTSGNVNVNAMSPAQMKDYAQSLYDTGKIGLDQLGILSAESYVRSFGRDSESAAAEVGKPLNWMKYIDDNMEFILIHGLDDASKHTYNNLSSIKKVLSGEAIG